MAEKLDSATLGATATSAAGANPVMGASLAGGSKLAAGGNANQDVANMSFEQAREALGQVVARLEAGGEPLESALALWERGEALAAHCQVWLDGARERFESVTAGSTAGGFAAEPF